MTHDPIAVAMAAGMLALPFFGTIVASAFIARRIARREFRRMFRHVVMVRGKGGKFERL